MHPLVYTALAVLVLIALVLYIFLPIAIALSISAKTKGSYMPYSQEPEGATRSILVAGDSTAVGTGAKDARDSVAGRIGSAYTDARIRNIGVYGDTLADLNLKLAAEEGPYDLVVLQIGGNDVTQATSLTDVRARLLRALDHAERLAPRTVVVTSGNIGLSPVFRWPLSTLVSLRTKEVRTIFIEEVGSREGMEYIDLYNERDEEPLNTDIPRFYAPDRFHPSGDGYGIWYDHIGPVVDDFLEN